MVLCTSTNYFRKKGKKLIYRSFIYNSQDREAPKCSSTDHNKAAVGVCVCARVCVYLYAIEYHSVTEKNEILHSATVWTALEYYA